MPVPMSLCELWHYFIHGQFNLSDISDYVNYMVISSDEEIPGMEEVQY